MNLTTLIRRVTIALTFLGAATGATFAASNFEGRVDMKLTSGKGDSESKSQPHLLHYTIKGEKIRMDFDGDASSRKNGMNSAGMIIDVEKREVITLIDSQDENGAPRKMFIRHPMNEPKAGKSSTSNKPEARDMSQPTPTGRTEKIAGYLASEYKVKDKDGNVTELWLAKGLGNFISPNSLNQMSRRSESPAWEAMLKEGGFFPLRVTTHDNDGDLVSQMEVVKIDKTSVSDSAFSTEGYSEMQMPFGPGGAGKRASSGLGDKLKGMNPFSR